MQNSKLTLHPSNEIYTITDSKVSYISQSESIDKFNSVEHMIGYMARVSNPTNQDNEDVSKLIRYCIKNKHWSVFEMATLTLEIITSRDISAQILRHRSFTFQEFSQRYALVTEFAPIEARLQDSHNRQSSIELTREQSELQNWLEEEYNNILHIAMKAYQSAIDKGIAKEVARKLLPINASTRMYMSGTLRSWIHYIELRTGNGTQKEHKTIALMAKKIFVQKYPLISDALGWIE